MINMYIGDIADRCLFDMQDMFRDVRQDETSEKDIRTVLNARIASDWMSNRNGQWWIERNQRIERYKQRIEEGKDLFG
jgi:hypothetical protein